MRTSNLAGAILPLRGIPVHKDPDAPRFKLSEVDGPPGVPWVRRLTKVPVSHTLIRLPGQAAYVVVHPDRWDDFQASIKRLQDRDRRLS